MTEASVQIRPAGVNDIPALTTFALALAHVHESFDGDRFVVPDENRFRGFFETEIARADTIILIAEIAAAPIAYAFVRLEPASIEELRDPAAWLHDVYIVPEARARGLGRLLVEAAFEAADKLGAKNLMLGVSPLNTSGRALFERMGFRPTMIEMCAEVKASE